MVGLSCLDIISLVVYDPKYFNLPTHLLKAKYVLTLTIESRLVVTFKLGSLYNSQNGGIRKDIR